MKKLIYILIASITMPACSAPEQEEGGQIMEYSGEENSEDTDDDTNIDDLEFETSWTQVIEAYIGNYEELAIMVLKETGENSDGLTEIEGYYFYEKHQKNLDVKGTKDAGTGKYVLTESYKGKSTGYMEFIPGRPGESYWSPKKGSEDKQEMTAKLLTGGDPQDMTLVLNHADFGFTHKVTMMNGEEDFETTDQLRVTYINEEFLAFYLEVVRTNTHVGTIAGVAKINGDKARFLINEDDDMMICDLEFDLREKNKVTITENNCSAWHGAYATFDGTYVKE